MRKPGIGSISIDGTGMFPAIHAEFRGTAIARIVIGGESAEGTPGNHLCEEEPAFAGNLRKDISDYLHGREVDFSRYTVDPEAGTAFQRRVWAALREIPYGETRSYGWIARKIGRPGAVRAVGGACGANPLPIIQPCHRVVCADGSIGGFSAGINVKRMLLGFEGVEL